MIEFFVIFLLVAPTLIAAILCGLLANARGRSAFMWGLFGAVVVVFAAIFRVCGSNFGGFGFDYGILAALAALFVCHIFTSGEKPEAPAIQKVKVASGFAPAMHAGQPMHDLGGGKFKVGFRTFKNIADARTHAEWLSKNP